MGGPPLHTAAYNHNQALALWDCLDAVDVAAGRDGRPLDLPLASSHMYARLIAAITPLGITTTVVPASECQSCP